MALPRRFPPRKRSAAELRAVASTLPDRPALPGFGAGWVLPAGPAPSLSQRQRPRERPAPFGEGSCDESFALIRAGFTQTHRSLEGLRGAQVFYVRVALIS